jgi:hypothetical protein
MNLLQLAAYSNDSIDFHMNFWKKTVEYIDGKDLCELVNFVDKNGYSFPMYASENPSNDVKKFYERNLKDFDNADNSDDDKDNMIVSVVAQTNHNEIRNRRIIRQCTYFSFY